MKIRFARRGVEVSTALGAGLWLAARGGWAELLNVVAYFPEQGRRRRVVEVRGRQATSLPLLLSSNTCDRARRLFQKNAMQLRRVGFRPWIWACDGRGIALVTPGWPIWFDFSEPFHQRTFRISIKCASFRRTRRPRRHLVINGTKVAQKLPSQRSKATCGESFWKISVSHNRKHSKQPTSLPLSRSTASLDRISDSQSQSKVQERELHMHGTESRTRPPISAWLPAPRKLKPGV